MDFAGASMGENIFDADFEFARRLHSELNGEKTQEELDFELAQAIQNQWNREDQMPEPELEEAQAQAVAPESHVSTENQQGITISRRRNSKDYFLDEIGTFINLEYNSEWAIINVLPDIQLIYDKINDNLYNSELPSMTVMWTEQDVIVGDQNFKISMSDHRIILNESTLLLRPRIDLFSVLLHITIHLYLHQQSFGEHNFHEHDSNFQKIMKHFNQIFRCQISCSHKFSCTGSEYKKQWYHCSGICQNYPPFRGIYRSATGPPSSQNSYWADHENYCGGSFFKLFEIYRNGLDGTERKYVKNAKYMNPKSLAAPTRIKTEFSPRELVDLTLDDDDQRGAQVIQLTDIIDLDLNDTPDLEAEETVDIANRFISNFNLKHSSVSNGITFCPICQNRVFQENFVLHLDGCKGNIQQVVFDPSKISYTRLRTEFQ